MKKVVLTVAIVLGGFSTYATSAFAMNTTDAIMVNIQQEQEYKQIENESLPQAVKDALEADFPTATLDKAYVSDAEEYKLEITVEGVSSTVYADMDGNWIEKE